MTRFGWRGRAHVVTGLIATTMIGVLMLTPRFAAAEQGFFIGDSIASAAGQILGIPGAARHSVSLRRNAIAPQFPRIPKGAIVLMSLGLNDAAIPVKAMRGDIETVIAGALATGERVVWIGPPCVLKKWDNRAREMDEYLDERLKTTTIQYVSLRDERICQPELRTGDGEHFTPSGYRYVFEKMRRDSSYAALVEIVTAKPPVHTASVKRKATKPAIQRKARAAKTRPRRAARQREDQDD